MLGVRAAALDGRLLEAAELLHGEYRRRSARGEHLRRNQYQVSWGAGPLKRLSVCEGAAGSGAAATAHQSLALSQLSVSAGQVWGQAEAHTPCWAVLWACCSCRCAKSCSRPATLACSSPTVSALPWLWLPTLRGSSCAQGSSTAGACSTPQVAIDSASAKRPDCSF